MSVANSVPSRSLQDRITMHAPEGFFSPFQSPVEWVALHKLTYRTNLHVMVSFRNVSLGVLFLTAVSVPIWGQRVAQTPLKPIHCPPLEVPTPVESFIQSKPGSSVDSTRLRRDLDSTYARMKGRWYLFQIQGGWSGPKLPHREVAITIDEVGNAVIAEKEKPLAVFRFKLRKDWMAIHSPLEGRKQSFFIGMTRELIVEVCQDTLVLNEAIGDGMEYVFKR
jgi:hypothetical protein